jgi:hypothetical protein
MSDLQDQEVIDNTSSDNEYTERDSIGTDTDENDGEETSSIDTDDEPASPISQNPSDTDDDTNSDDYGEKSGGMHDLGMLLGSLFVDPKSKKNVAEILSDIHKCLSKKK